MRSSQKVRSAELLALFLPIDREGLHQLQQAGRGPAIQNLLNDIRSEQRQPQDTAHVGSIDPFGIGELGRLGIDTVVQQLLPPSGATERLDQAPTGTISRRDDALAAAPPLEHRCGPPPKGQHVGKISAAAVTVRGIGVASA